MMFRSGSLLGCGRFGLASRLARAASCALLAGAVALTAACGDAQDGHITDGAKSQTGPAGDAAWQKVVEAAKSEGEVTIYSSYSRESLEGLGKRFKEEYGIKVNVVREVDATLQQKLSAESQTGKQIGDVVAQATASWAQEKGAAGFFSPPVGPAFSSEDYLAKKTVASGGTFVSSATVMTFAWNTDRHPGGMTNYSGLLDPALAGGKIGVISPVSGAILDFYKYLDANYGKGFVEKLAAQKPRIYTTALAISQALGSGEIAAAAYVQPQYTQKSEGVPVDSGMAPRPWAAPFYTGVLAGAPHPNAAQLLANYMITPAGQEPLALRSASVTPNIATAVTTIDQIAPQDPALMNTAALDEFRREFDRLFT